MTPANVTAAANKVQALLFVVVVVVVVVAVVVCLFVSCLFMALAYTYWLIVFRMSFCNRSNVKVLT